MADGTDGAAGHRVALVLSGGVALGAYHAGAYAALREAGGPEPEWLVGASIGAVVAAIIAGNPPDRRVARLRRFWEAVATEALPNATPWIGRAGLDSRWRRAEGWANAIQARVLGRPGLFRPRLLAGMATTDDSAGPGLYDLAPLHDRLPEVIDFDLLNAAAPEGRAPRLTVVATDIASGERVVFDTRRRGRAGGGGPIGPEHLIASCALMPDFAPVAVGDRLLGDGGFTANAPLDLVLDEPAPPDDPRPLLCFLLELFPQRGERPRTLAGAAARASDLVFGGQTGLILEGRRREHRLRAMVAALAPRLPPELRRDPEVAALLAEGRAAEAAPLVLSLTYHPPAGEADLQRTFDFSRTALAGRWAAGAEHMGAALRALRALPGLSEAEGAAAAGRPGLRVHEVGRPGPPAAPGGSAGGPDSPGQAAAAGVGARGAA